MLFIGDVHTSQWSSSKGKLETEKDSENGRRVCLPSRQEEHECFSVLLQLKGKLRRSCCIAETPGCPRRACHRSRPTESATGAGAAGDARSGYRSSGLLHRSSTILVCRSLTEKPKASNSTVTGFWRVRARTETKLVMRCGETRTSYKRIGAPEEGRERPPRWVMGREEPSPTMMRVEVGKGRE